jgi:outer membrane lipoprotein SlyB
LGSMQKIILTALLLGFTVTAHADDKKPAGTAKGAAAGAVVGHEVGGGHAVAGAAAGAIIGHHEAKKAEESKAQ